jgi:hypothetical protein
MSATVPNLYQSDKATAKGSGTIFIPKRKDANHSGTFRIKIAISFDPAANDYPTGSIRLQVELNDSVKGIYTSTSIETINSLGRVTPTLFVTGRCRVETDIKLKSPIVGCKYWLMVADNKSPNDKQGSPDIVSFVIHDRLGKRIAYGTGQVSDGDDIVVLPM